MRITLECKIEMVSTSVIDYAMRVYFFLLSICGHSLILANNRFAHWFSHSLSTNPARSRSMANGYFPRNTWAFYSQFTKRKRKYYISSGMTCSLSDYIYSRWMTSQWPLIILILCIQKFLFFFYFWTVNKHLMRWVNHFHVFCSFIQVGRFIHMDGWMLGVSSVRVNEFYQWKNAMQNVASNECQPTTNMHGYHNQ